MSQVALLFPGQGSQEVGMGQDLVEREPRLLEQYFRTADEILGFELTRLCFEGPAEELRATQNTQPAIFTVSMAVLDVLRQHGVRPAAVAGHSLGEYAALACAGVLGFAEGLRLVRRRGEMMAAVNERTPGAMAAVIGVPPEQVQQLCGRAQQETGAVVEPANYNEPAQTVVSGEQAGVDRLGALAGDLGARVVPLEVGAPFHCSLMQDMAREFATELDAVEFGEPQMPVVANVTGDYVRTAQEVKDALRRQVAGSVRWTETMQRLAGDGHDTFVECGPGRVLFGFARKIVPDAGLHAAGDARRLERALDALREP